jgi:hypothetical protein
MYSYEFLLCEKEGLECPIIKISIREETDIETNDYNYTKIPFNMNMSIYFTNQAITEKVSAEFKLFEAILYQDPTKINRFFMSRDLYPRQGVFQL